MVEGNVEENVLRLSFQVWDACSESVISFDQANANDENSLAYIVENDVIQSCLLERLKQLDVEPRLAAKVKEFQSENNAIRVELQNQKVPLRTRLLVSGELFPYDPTNSVETSDRCGRVFIEYSRHGENHHDAMGLQPSGNRRHASTRG